MKIYILTFGLLFFSIIANSQKINSISFNPGISRSNLWWNYDENNSYIEYSNLGGQEISYGTYSTVEIEYFERKYIAIVSGLGFYQKGGGNSLESSPYSWNLDYLTFDTKLKVKYKFKNLTPYLLIGPRFDYLIKYSSGFVAIDGLATLNKTNYGLRYGTGLQYYFKKLILGFGWESNINFNSIAEKNGEDIPKFTLSDKTMVFKCEIGYQFNK